MKLFKPAPGSQFTICEVAIYEEENLISLINDTDEEEPYDWATHSTPYSPPTLPPWVPPSDPNPIGNGCDLEIDNTLVEHPIYFGIQS